MKFKVASGKTEWFKGQITKYDGLTGKYGIYFPCDGETICVSKRQGHEVCLITIITVYEHHCYPLPSI